MNLPSREECEGWNQGQVALFMCKNNMQECAVTVNRLRINGQRLLNLSESDMSKFSLIHQPQLQKIVQDIKKNDGSFLNKLRRLKGKPVPKLPARDYRDEDQQSESDYDNEMYENRHGDQDDSYEPPPSHRVFTTTHTASLPRGEYLDNCREQPQRPPRKPLRPVKASKQLPPQPTHMGSDEDDYIDPDSSNEDENYVQPAENPPSNAIMLVESRAGGDRPMLPTPSPECPPSPDVYEVPDNNQDNTYPNPDQVGRQSHSPTIKSHPLPPKPSPRLNKERPPTIVPEPTEEDEYEVCDPVDDSPSDKHPKSSPLLPPKPLPRERSPKPPLKPKPNTKIRELEIEPLPVIPTQQKPSPKALSMDFKRPMIPRPQFGSLSADRGSSAAENGFTDEDMDADVCKKFWYASQCDRKTADDALLNSNKDGAFMVRNSSGQDAQQPYTLVVFYKGRVYNIPIRFIATTQQYALGREKKGEEYFSSVSHIIENHQRNPLVLIDSQSNTKDATKLCYPVRP